MSANGETDKKSVAARLVGMASCGSLRLTGKTRSDTGRGGFQRGAKGTRTSDRHTARVKLPVLQRDTASTAYRIMPACNPYPYRYVSDVLAGDWVS